MLKGIKYQPCAVRSRPSGNPFSEFLLFEGILPVPYPYPIYGYIQLNIVFTSLDLYFGCLDLYFGCLYSRRMWLWCARSPPPPSPHPPPPPGSACTCGFVNEHRFERASKHTMVHEPAAGVFSILFWTRPWNLGARRFSRRHPMWHPKHQSIHPKYKSRHVNTIFNCIQQYI